jgi:hypothetical protein
VETQIHNYRLSYKEWIIGIRLARRRNLVWMLRFLMSWLIPLFILYLDIAVVWNAFRGEAHWGDAANGALVLTLLLILLLGYRVFRLRRVYSRSAIARHAEGLALAFNEEYFVSGLPGRSEGRFLWTAIYDFAEGDRVALLYTSKKQFIVIPKDAMPEESWAAFRKLAPTRKAKPDAD